jgi:hypothetical protein
MPKDERDEEHKPKFRIVDKRVEDDEEAPPEAAPKPKAPPAAEKKASAKSATPPQPSESEEAAVEGGEPELSEEEKEELRKQVEASLTFKNTVIFILRTLSEQVWIHLGLVPNPITNLTVKNLPEARKAIDLFDNIAKFAESEFDPMLIKEVQRLLSDLKMNYTNQVGG